MYFKELVGDPSKWHMSDCFCYFVSMSNTRSHFHVTADYLLLIFLQYIVGFWQGIFATPVMGMGGGTNICSIRHPIYNCYRFLNGSSMFLVIFSLITSENHGKLLYTCFSV